MIVYESDRIHWPETGYGVVHDCAQVEAGPLFGCSVEIIVKRDVEECRLIEHDVSRVANLDRRSLPSLQRP
jgi:hypothetical protein